MKQEHKYSMFLRTSFLSFSKNLHCFLVTRGIQGLSSFVSTALEVTRLIIVVQHYSHFLNSVWICKFLQVLRETLKKMYWLYVAGIPVRRALFRLSRFLCATLSLCGFMPFGCSGPSNWNNTQLWVHFMRMMELIYILDSDLHGSN
jgi:hypothetical protein